MNNEQALTINRSNIIASTKFIALIGVATIVPLFHQQLITGPIVNATLFVATIIIGTRAGILVGLIPSVIALPIGTLPVPLAPMVPYIMLSNVILILTFGYLKNKNYWLAVGVASFFKFIFLFVTSLVVTDLLLKKELAESVIIMLSYPQLLTALAGGVLASLFLGYCKNYCSKNNQ